MKRQLIQATKAFMLLVAFYFLAGLAAYVVPDWRVRKNVQRTVDRGDLCEDYPKAVISDTPGIQDAFTLDNFTDALIVNQALMMRSEGLKGVLLLPRYNTNKDNQCACLRDLLEVPPEEGGRTPNFTKHTEYGGRVIYYGRYWHGSTFITRLLLSVLTFTDIRLLLYIVTSLLMLWCCLCLWQRVDRVVGVALLISLLAVNVFVMQFSMQFAPVLIITLGALIWMAYHPHATSHCLLLFVVGSLTACFDLITVPSVSLGLPLLVWVAMERPTEWRRGLRGLVSLALWWAVGYALTWLAKWGLATLFTGVNIFTDAYDEAMIWSNDGGNYLLGAIGDNLSRLCWPCVVLPLAALAVLAAVKPRKGVWVTVAMYALVMLIPLVYYLLMAKPAQHHNWFNYRALVTAVAALLMAVASLVDWNKVKLTRHE